MLGFTVHIIRQQELKMLHDLEFNLEKTNSQNKQI